MVTPQARLTLELQHQMAAALRAEQCRQLYQGLPMALLSNLIFPLLLALLQWSAVSHPRLLIWIGLHYVLTALRYRLLLAYRHAEMMNPGFIDLVSNTLVSDSAARMWLARFRWAVIASGISWGLGSIFLFSPHDAVHQLLLGLVLLGVSAGAMFVLAVDMWSAFGFVIFALSSYMLMILLDRTDGAGLLCTMGVLYIGYFNLCSRRVQNNQLENIRLRMESALRSEELQATEQRWNFALEGTGDGVWDWNIVTNKVLYSRRWKELLGYTEAEIGDEFAEWEKRVHADDLSLVNAEIQAHLDGSTSAYSAVHRVRCKGGNWKWVLDRGRVVIRDHEGKPLRIIGTLTDITERKQAEMMQLALHSISEAAHATEDLLDLFKRIHEIIGELLPAKNFFVALYDETNDILTFPYYVDEYDSAPAPRKLGDGTLTSEVIRTGEALLLTPEMQAQRSEQIVGSDSLDWLGVPLVSSKRIVGVLTVQSYSGEIRYTDKDKTLLQFVSTQIANTIERKQTEERIRHMAQYDVLTHLPNRALFSDRLQVAIAKVKRDKSHMALMFMDLDKFKPVNDRYGHAVGDLLLQEVAVRVQSCVRESDTVGRIGGDEFVILLKAIKKTENALLVGEKIRAALERPVAINGLTLSISASIGIAVYPQHGLDEIQLSKSADDAMYRAKKAGSNRVELYSEPAN